MYAHPAIAEYNRTTDSSNRTVSTLMKIITTLRKQDDGEEEDEFYKLHHITITIYLNIGMTYKRKRLWFARKIRKTYKKIVEDLKNPAKFHYDDARAKHAIYFIENYCRHSQGEFGGKKDNT